MKGFFERHKDNAMLATVLASMVSLFASGFSVYYTYTAGVMTQDRQAKLEAIAAFDQSNNGVVEVVGEFIFAINESKDTAEAKKKLAQLAAKQTNELERLRLLFKSVRDIKSYESNLEDFARIAQKTNSSTEMRAAIEGFDRVNNSKTSTMQSLYSTLGISG